MNANETRLLIIAVAAVFVLFFYRERLIRLIIKTKFGSLDWQNAPSEDKGLNDQTAKTHYKKVLPGDPKSIAAPALPVEPFHVPAWLLRRWLKISVLLALVLLSIAMPFWWWNCHSEFWKLEFSHHISEAWVLWKQGPRTLKRDPRSDNTLQELTRLLDGYANILASDPHRVIELWVVDHYWQYWATDTFNDYLRANRRFVDSGGKIHRMFILTGADLQNPQLTAVLRNQCEKIGADVWRGDATAIADKTEYQVTQKAFEQMPYTETGFRSFDVLQLEDLTYYSSDFSPDYRVVGASNWLPGRMLDLKPLFNKSVAQRIDCSAWNTSQIAQSQ